MIFNAGGGSCGPLGYAAIGAVFSPNSDCTCSNGTLTYTANNADGYIVFGIPSNGTWTVTCGSISKTITITHKGQCEIANVKRLYLFYDGEADNKPGTLTPLIDKSFQWGSRCGQYGDHDGNAALLKLIDLTPYNTIGCKTFFRAGPRSGAMGFYVGQSIPPSNGSDKTTSSWQVYWPDPIETEETFTFDVSSYSGQYYVGINYFGISAFVCNGSIKATHFYLE